MAVLRAIGHFFKLLLLLAFLTVFIVCTVSSGADLQRGIMQMMGYRWITLSSGTFTPEDTRISAVLADGETALLEEMTALRYADFSGSSNYEEILQWAQAHPEVTVVYTVPLPGGSTAANDASALSLPGMRHEDTGALLSALRYLPAVNSIDLGTSSQSASPVTAGDIQQLQAFREGLTVSYGVDLLGASLPLSTESVDLTGITSAQVPEVAAALSSLPSLRTIRIADNATTDGSLTWDDLTVISHAAPAASVDYKFTVCGVSATTADTSLDLRAMRPEDLGSVLGVLPAMTQLRSIELGDSSSGLSWDNIAAVAAAAPEAALSYSFSVYGVPVNMSDTVLDLNHIAVSDNAEELKRVLPYMKSLTTLDMDSCGVPDSVMAEIREAYPSVNVIWRVWFGSNYSCRTDVVKILASKPSKGGALTDSNSYGLRYCTKVRYLDLGHNEDLTDFSFIRNMPDLEIAVISMTGIYDLTPFAGCSRLAYLEMGNTNVSDVSPLASCTSLRHLNIGTNYGISDISSLYDIPLIRLWIGAADPGPQEQIDTFQSMHPGCEINTTAPSGNERDELGNVINEGFTSGNWKIYQRYLTYDWDVYAKYNYFPDQRPLGYFKVVYLAFEYNLKDGAYSFSWNDPLYDPHDGSAEPAHMKIVDTSLLFEEWHDHDILTPIYPEDESYG